jgi:hypothetical protein
MWTLCFALLGALLLGASWEGTIKAPGILASCSFVAWGKVRAFGFAYRPGRLYVRIGAG